MHTASNLTLLALLFSQYFTENDGEDIINGARKNTRRYQNIFADAADAAMPLATAVNTDEDVFDVLMRQVCFKRICRYVPTLSHALL